MVRFRHSVRMPRHPSRNPPPQPSRPGKTLVLITTETFGRGDDELGEKKLMGNFLSTLPELGEACGASFC